jgi:two-component system chemotaxis response regulator CheB
MPEAARVLIVDDSRIFRAAVEEALAAEEGIRVVGSVYSGEKALEFIRATPPDVVTLDVQMPGMDGVQTLEEIQRLNAARPERDAVGVIMVSSFTRKGADVTVRALQAGAFDFVTKPSGPCADACLESLRQQLACKIRLFQARRCCPGPRPAAAPAPPHPAARAAKPARAVLIATSTGGPRALTALLPQLCGRVEAPIVVVQHMPVGFTASLAASLDRQSCHAVVEAADGEPLRPRTVYIAPGGKHLLLRRGPSGEVLTALNEHPPEGGCRPSADVLFRSAAAALGGEAVAVVLTGMGCDGTAGLAALRRAGGHVIVQDEASSVVWGMPGSAVAAGLADAVLPLEQIAAAVEPLVGGRRGRVT